MSSKEKSLLFVGSSLHKQCEDFRLVAYRVVSVDQYYHVLEQIAAYIFRTDLGYFDKSEDGGNKLFRNISSYLPIDRISCPRRLESSSTLL
jgi:hypothetical protein